MAAGGLYSLLSRRPRKRTGCQKLAEEKAHLRKNSISQIGECFAHLNPAGELAHGASSPFSRRPCGLAFPIGRPARWRLFHVPA